MPQKPEPISNKEGTLLNRIRVETAFSRFPSHQLSKTGTISIDLRGEDPSTEDLDFPWMVSSNKEYGHPGPLSLKIDKLIIDRRIDEAPSPLPEVLRLGSLREICRQLRISDHDTDPVKKALHQNASVYITAKIQCQMKTRSMERSRLQPLFSNFHGSDTALRHAGRCGLCCAQRPLPYPT